MTAMNDQTWKTEAELIRLALSIMFGSFAFLILIHLINFMFEVEWLQLVMYKFCMASGSPLGNLRPTLLSFLAIVFRIFFLVSTLIIDVCTLLMVKNWERDSSQIQGDQRHFMNEIPLLSSLLNMIVLMAFIMTHIITYQFYPEYFPISFRYLQMLFFLFKSPIVIYLANIVTASNIVSDENEERERKRNIEIQDAIKRRNDRLARQLAMQDEGEGM